ncbi:LTR-retrotransposon skipper [Tieghemostelium lacteum]|uniref:LTR-retrotransposon skipper n=2 Tax=Tieghemostelium lacteum TaxID=361077 RepID=A0A152A4M5_TIELA|nr:LTR-retrotransposon skipper [Tieghemostelium lacteum]|eukprot:KYR01186.1 LTR-retrotransposon skipper [Tieghemostelium lacteum]
MSDNNNFNNHANKLFNNLKNMEFNEVDSIASIYEYMTRLSALIKEQLRVEFEEKFKLHVLNSDAIKSELSAVNRDLQNQLIDSKADNKYYQDMLNQKEYLFSISNHLSILLTYFPNTTNDQQVRRIERWLEILNRTLTKNLKIMNKKNFSPNFFEKHCFKKNDLIYYYDKNSDSPRLFIVDADIIKEILHDSHTSLSAGHIGRDRLIQKLTPLYYWFKFIATIEKYVKNCLDCQKAKADTIKQGHLVSLPIPARSFSDISMDFMQLPRTVSGKDNLLVIVCRLSKYAILIPCTTKITTDEVADAFINEVVSIFGLPRTIVSDRDSKFTSDLWSQLMNRLNIKIKMTAPGRPQADGQTERTNRTIKETLMKIGNRTNWDRDIKITQMALNNSTNASTKLTPTETILGFIPKLPINTLTSQQDFNDTLDNIKTKRMIAQNNMLEAQLNQASYYDKKRVNINYSVGDLVLIKREKLNITHSADIKAERKLLGRYCGPFRITKKFENNVVIRMSSKNNKTRVVNVDDIILFNEEDNIINQHETDDYQINDIQKLITKRDRKYGRGSRIEYLARINGLTEDHDIWYAASHLSRTEYGSQLVQDFEDAQTIDDIDPVNPNQLEIEDNFDLSDNNDLSDEDHS